MKKSSKNVHYTGNKAKNSKISPSIYLRDYVLAKKIAKPQPKFIGIDLAVEKITPTNLMTGVLRKEID